MRTNGYGFSIIARWMPTVHLVLALVAIVLALHLKTIGRGAQLWRDNMG